jgi:2-dehydro-3-deoxyglucarate aldolase/4-hydroxy-2-oxoheptanedioate aldolase
VIEEHKTFGFAKALAETDRPLVGTWAKIPSLETIEILADAGFDFVVVDMEHAPLTFAEAYSAMVVAQSVGMHAIVRVPDRSGSHLQRILDAGADGILVPRVETVEQAAEAAAGMTFSPEGRRGAGITARAGRWGGFDFPTYLSRGEGVMRGIQLEDRGALEIVDEILAVPHLNGAFLGMGDLQLSTRLAMADPGLQALEAAFHAAARKHGIPTGTAVGTAEQAAAAVARGHRFVMVSNDTGLLRGAAADVVAATRARL